MPNSISNIDLQSPPNSWIICRSKSYLNRIYYFNNKTGEAVWNLSEAEMKKARKATKIFEQSDCITNDNCPEPKGSPEDYLHKNKYATNEKTLSTVINPNVYNKQIINNQFTKVANVPSINSMQYGIGVPSMYPVIWNIPPQPVILTPNDYSAPPNSEYIPVTGTNVSLSARFKSLPDADSTRSKFYNKQNLIEETDGLTSPNSVNSMVTKKKKKKELTTKRDLREVLSANRRSVRRDSTLSTFDGERASISPNSKNKNALLNMRDEEWLVENLRSNLYSNLDTSELRKLLNLENNTGIWYIVTDTNVLLNNTNFLKVLLHTDKECNLILPRAVVEEIESMAESNPQALKASYFISQQVDLKQVVIDEETIGQKYCHTSYIKNEILGCCSRLTEQGCAVALISNNIEILHLKETVTYHIITIREVKLLTCRSTIPNTANIKITISNGSDNISLEKEESNSIVTEKITFCNGSDDISLENKETNYIVTDNGSQVNSNQDISISSNFEIGEEANVTAKPVSFVPMNIITNSNQFTSDSVLGININTPYINKNELKRRSSHDNSQSVSNEVKNFKGRRKKNNADNNLNETDSIASNGNVCQSHNNDVNETQSAFILNVVTNEINSETTDHLQDFNDELKDDTTINNSNIRRRRRRRASAASSVKDDKHVMFEITGPTMEENLRMKCDELVSRFTQIMEEVLTVVLNEEPKFVCEAMPPPWSLYEATECTRKKFDSDCDVVDAANKLRNILFDIGGSRGKVKTNISPQQYMELYSYGVYLTDALQGVINHCEGLHTAEEALANLLRGIQCTNLVIKEEKLDNVSDNREKQLTEDRNPKVNELKDVPQSRNISDKGQQSVSNEVISSPTKYNLRTNKSRSSLLVCPCEKTNISTNAETNFFNSLHLEKCTIRDVSENKEQTSTEENLNPSNECDEIDSGHIVSGDNSEKTESVVIKDTNIGDVKNIEPIFKRKFVLISDMEERIENNYNFMQVEDDSFNQESGEYYDFDNGYISNCEYYESEMDQGYPLENEKYEEKEHNMNCFIQNIIKESKGVLSLVKMFCEKSYDVLKSSPNEFDKSEILRDAEEANSNISNICDTFNSILKRETSNCEESIRAVSKNPKFKSLEMSEEESQNYRNVIAKCLEQGNILKESLTLIINGVKSERQRRK